MNKNKTLSKKEEYKKFIGSRAEGQGFADKRKKKIQYEYLKLKKKEERTTHHIQASKPRREININQRSQFKGKAPKLHTFTHAQSLSEKQKTEELKKKKEIISKKQEINQALEKYNNLKKSRNLKLCKRTHRGQPVMKNQIEYLLEKIQKQMNKSE